MTAERTVPTAVLLNDRARIPYPERLSPQAQGHMEEARRLGTPNPDVYRIAAAVTRSREGASPTRRGPVTGWFGGRRGGQLDE